MVLWYIDYFELVTLEKEQMHGEAFVLFFKLIFIGVELLYNVVLVSQIRSDQSLSRVRLFATPWTIARQAPLPMEFSRQEYRSGLPFPPPGIKPGSSALQANFFSPSEPQGKKRL